MKEHLLGDYNWDEAVEVACRDKRAAVPGSTVATDAFTKDDVESVIAYSDGVHDEQSWVGVFLLKDGRFAAVHAWCDYTGWGCRDGGSVDFAATLQAIIRLGLDDEERARLNLS